MAERDYLADVTPQLPAVNKPARHAGRPTISSLKTALGTVNGGASYTAARLSAMSHTDLVYAARLHGVSPVTTF